MKYILTLLYTFLFITSFGKNGTLEKLTEVNKYWSEQKDIQPDKLPQFRGNEKEWITLHLSLVEKTLRARSTVNLSSAQLQNRNLCLNYLHDYWCKGNFPINEDYNYRTPIFIDRHDNFCAVGYLIKASGHEDISRTIAAHTNLAYVYEMKYPELAAWAKEYGFTINELAWIQPGYPSPMHSKPVGGGVDGEINELYTDSVNSRLYVGGRFVNADSTIVVNNIAYVTQVDTFYTWHNMGSGTNGPINAIIKYGSLIFAGGAFTIAGDSAVNNVAYWDGALWHNAGCISGTINSFLVFHDTLYAAGTFDICPATPGVNFAWWDGNNWQGIPGLTGKINKIQAMDTVLILGGAFSLGTDTVNIIKWNAQTGFMPFLNNIDNEVKDIELYQDTMYTVCKRTNSIDTNNLFQKLRGNTWVQAYTGYGGIFYPEFGSLSFNTLCAESNTLNMGGAFSFTPFVGYDYENCYSIGYYPSFLVDSAVNKMTFFNSDIIAGGKFKNGFNDPYTIRLNGIAKRDLASLTVPEITTDVFSIYPNPTNQWSTMTIKNNFYATHFIVKDIMSRTLAEGQVHSPVCELPIPNLVPGLYFIDVSNDNGKHTVKKFTVQ